MCSFPTCLLYENFISGSCTAFISVNWIFAACKSHITSERVPAFLFFCISFYLKSTQATNLTNLPSIKVYCIFQQICSVETKKNGSSKNSYHSQKIDPCENSKFVNSVAQSCPRYSGTALKWRWDGGSLWLQDSQIKNC